MGSEKWRTTSRLFSIDSKPDQNGSKSTPPSPHTAYRRAASYSPKWLTCAIKSETWSTPHVFSTTSLTLMSSCTTPSSELTLTTPCIPLRSESTSKCSLIASSYQIGSHSLSCSNHARASGRVTWGSKFTVTSSNSGLRPTS